MKNEYLFRASLYAMVCLATLCLWLGEDSPAPYPWVVLLCAIAAFVFTDHWEKLVIPRLLAPILGLIALALFVREELHNYAIDAVLPLGHFFIFLQVILFFHKKKTAYYWFMMAMSFLQTMIAALHNNKLLFGVLLALYLVLGLWTLMQFSLVREAERFGGEVSSARPRLLGRSFLASLGGGVIALGLATFLFLLIPRQGQTAWTQASPFRPGQYLTGFDERIRLGQLGTILESDDEVMTIQMTDEQGNAYRPTDEPLWRGVVLGHYEGGSWERIVVDVQENLSPWQPTRDKFIRQDIRVQAVHRDVLFGLRPALRGYTRSGTPLGLVRSDGTIVRPDIVPQGPLQYTIESAREPLSSQPRELPPNMVFNQPYLLAQMTQVPDELREPLRQYVQSLGIPANNDVALAGELLRHLQDPTQFDYTLRAEVADPDIDPVLDFLINRREGHCEYFASALALLLRSHNVPARVVNGFKGGDWNDLIVKSVVVRQKHAHSWVEALIDRRNPRWVTLDPTPGQGRQQQVAMVSHTPSLLRQMRDVSRQVWSSYILNFNSTEQEAAIYGPVRRTIVDQTRKMIERAKSAVQTQPRQFNWLAAILSSAVTAVAVLIVWVVLGILRVRSAMLSANGGGAEVGLLRQWQRLLRGLWRWWVRAPTRRGSGVAFYEQMVETLSMHGLPKPAPWTPRQFARWAGDELRRRPHASTIADIPAQLVDRFYEIRFGDRSLSSAEDAEVNRLVSSLTHALRQAPRNGSAAPARSAGPIA